MSKYTYFDGAIVVYGDALYGDETVIKLNGADVYTIPSRSTPDLLHKVTHWRGSWDCSCIGYRNHKHCYHIDEVRKVVSY